MKKILWVVTKRNPLKKKPNLSKKERIKLSKKITKNNKKIFVKYFDEKIKSSNTFNLIKYIKKKNSMSKIYFIIGADNLKKLHKWKNWEKIPQLAKIVVFPRKNYTFNTLASKKHSKKDVI